MKKHRRISFPLVALMLVCFGGGFILLRPIFWSNSSVSSPEKFQKGAEDLAFVEVTQEAGIRHIHQKPQLDPKVEPIMPWLSSVGAAACAGDFDNDGWMDLYVTNSQKGTPNYLYRNLGNGQFSDVASAAGVADVNNDSGVSTDCVWGDYNNDGFLDLYVVKWGFDTLFKNNGDGSFTDVTEQAFPNKDKLWANGCSAIWFDYDRDGHLDLYVGNYFAPVDLWHLKHTRIMHDDFETSRNAGRNFMFKNNADGSFSEVAAQLGLDDPGWTLSVGHGDLNNDGWPEIYNANDFGSDQLFFNQGDGSFVNTTEKVFGGDTKKGMNVDFGDFDGNGWLDIYVTNITTADYLKEGNMLWYNDADDEEGLPIFLDISVDSETYDGGWGWGARFFDFDNDGDLDIVTLNGFITAGPDSYWYDLASWTVTGDDVADALKWPRIGDRSFSGNEPARLFRNEGQQRFSEIAAEAGMANRADGRGVVSFDYDNDGDLDLFMANQGTAPALYRNNVGDRGNWLALNLVGNTAAGSNRNAIGARATIVTPMGNQIRELDGGNSFCAQSDRRLYFGLGDYYAVSTLEIRWPSGGVQVLENIPANQILTIEEPEQTTRASLLIPTQRDAVVRVRETPEIVLPAEQIETLLSDLESKVRAQPDDLVSASRYRDQCVKLGEQKRSVAFFEQLARDLPTNRSVRLQLSGAYVDAIPTCGGMAAIVCKGTKARQALDQMDLLIKDDATWWPSIYSRATNHLHWPRALQHSNDAARDFRTLIQLQETAGDHRGYYVRAHVGLGDALAKDGLFKQAHEAWQHGATLFPQHNGLRERLALSEDKARAYVEEKCNLDRQIDTDFSFLVNP